MRLLQCFYRNTWHVNIYCIAFFLLHFVVSATAQGPVPEKPPRPIEVTVIQNLSFGDIVKPIDVSGSVTQHPRTGQTFSTNSIFLMPSSSSTPAWFRITSNIGTSLSISVADVQLSNGTNFLDLKFEGAFAYPGTSFIASATTTDLYIGGTLYLPAFFPYVTYNGTFSVTVNQE